MHRHWTGEECLQTKRERNRQAKWNNSKWLDQTNVEQGKTRNGRRSEQRGHLGGSEPLLCIGVALVCDVACCTWGRLHVYVRLAAYFLSNDEYNTWVWTVIWHWTIYKFQAVFVGVNAEEQEYESSFCYQPILKISRTPCIGLPPFLGSQCQNRNRQAPSSAQTSSGWSGGGLWWVLGQVQKHFICWRRKRPLMQGTERTKRDDLLFSEFALQRCRTLMSSNLYFLNFLRSKE